ncbi:MAG: histidinol-phosphatase [Muribaculaceae bacterium]|nr:histidinol-phosphatase [Muribaculaceae bacterium]
MKTNLHSHTQYCDGRSSMEEIISAALEAGFSTWGFSPHAPISLESPCNMKIEDVSLYLKEIERLRKLFPGIKILAGMEVDYLDDDNGPSSPQVKDYGLDYVIGSVHFIPNQEGEFFDIDGSPERFKRILNEHFKGDLNYVVRTFWEQTRKMIAAGGLNIVGHIDKIALNASFVNPEIENDPEYKKMAEETIDLAIKKGLQLEINTKHWEKYGRFFPNPHYWAHIINSGIKMPINSDAHYADRIESGISQAVTLLNTLNLKI